MRALVFDGSKPTLIDDHPEPTPAPGEAVIRPLVAGVCSTDLEICRGYMGFTGVLGHEFVGVVESLGNAADEEAKDLLGRRVVGTINCVCGECDMCRRGLREHCRDRTVLGIAGRDGCFAERFCLPVENLIPVPDPIDNDRAVFTEPLAAACQVTRQLPIEGTPYITVLGDGRLGLLVAQVMNQLNASVRVIGKHDDKLALCDRWQVRSRRLDQVMPRGDQDIVIDCTGSASGLDTALRMVRPRGTVVLKTTVNDQKGVDLSPVVIHEVNIVGSRCGPFGEALGQLLGEQVDVLPMISKRVRFSRAVEALAAADQPGALKVLIEFA